MDVLGLISSLMTQADEIENAKLLYVELDESRKKMWVAHKIGASHPHQVHRYEGFISLRMIHFVYHCEPS